MSICVTTNIVNQNFKVPFISLSYLKSCMFALEKRATSVESLRTHFESIACKQCLFLTGD